MRRDIDFAVEVLSKLTEPSTDERVRNGQRLRAKYIEVIKAGGDPDGYRWEWLRKSTGELVELLQMMADDFNKAHPDDFCTIQDLLDIVAGTEGRLRKVAGDSQKK